MAHFSQQNAERTNFADGSFASLVFSRILLHETSRAAVPRIFAECHRLLRQGGVMFHSDAPQFDELDPYVASLRDWDITCNNEPFMDVCYELLLEDLYTAAGFDRAATFRAKAPSSPRSGHRHRSARDPLRRQHVSGRRNQTGVPGQQGAGAPDLLKCNGPALWKRGRQIIR